MPNLTVPARVERGAALLDSTVPEWPHRVSVERLAFDENRDVLGQVFGSYARGYDILGRPIGRSFEPAEYGFTIYPNEPPSVRTEIVEAWRALVQQRKASR